MQQTSSSSLPLLSLPERLVWGALRLVLRALARLPREEWIAVRRALRTILLRDDAGASQAGLTRLLAALEQAHLTEHN
jgi:hypothetical protein